MAHARIPQDGRRYHLARHHAWGGLGLLSVVWMLRVLCPSLPDAVMVPLIGVLIVYVMVWLFLTYRYRTELKEEAPGSAPRGNGGPASSKAARKAEKKRIKAELKARKKGA